jgi:hypothetical protein
MLDNGGEGAINEQYEPMHFVGLNPPLTRNLVDVQLLSKMKWRRGWDSNPRDR